MRQLFGAAALLLAQAYSGVDMRQNGAAIGRARYVNCSTNMTCWVDGGVGFVTSTSGSCLEILRVGSTATTASGIYGAIAEVMER